MSGVARTLKEAARLTSATRSLILRSSEDLVCMNLMCPKVGGACLCRLAVTVSRLQGLRELDIANNDLGVLPESVFELPVLEQLDISGELWLPADWVVSVYMCCIAVRLIIWTRTNKKSESSTY